ncbi:DUF1330 domain-containing protein [Streptomyces scopuliridis]|uniref:DUF1330 domain-containing protein n=1 Tax=Streptomyces scopuliridis TaxID=452529 RepID=A0ACD4ZXZ6_9ACTN|nr:DUF1330 domain-containing protein [Streptomyces scopuliridis]WSB38235.1 DUF1330 domain-containing protein [Streptomyces scopuliridis]WSC02668.1 DUF1330 domain-containing protein [Streptomyces scopuliridis]WSC03800.1 DUF1330 domain-containing protein [Streptomyces scopuliridis]
MTAYVLVDAQVLDGERARGYRALAEPSIQLYGGRYLVQGTVPEVVEGTWPSSRVATVLEFPDMDRLKEWYASAEYQEAKAVRGAAIELRMLFVEGKPA